MTRRWVSCLAAVAVAAVMLSGCGGGGGGSEPVAGVQVNGRVVSAVDGTGIANAKVTIGGKSGTTTTTGYYVVLDVLTGERELTVSLANYSLPGGKRSVTISTDPTNLGNVVMVPSSSLPPTGP